MDRNAQQPHVRRRLDFEDMEIETQHGNFLPGDRQGRDAPLPSIPRDDQPDHDECIEETDTESAPGTPPRNAMGGIRILYQGYDRPRQVRRPRPGMATIIARDGDGLTTVYNLPLGQVQLALEDGEETESEGGSDGDEDLN